MQLTKLRAAPVRQAEVPPCAPAGQMDGGTASQLIRGFDVRVGELRDETAERLLRQAISQGCWAYRENRPERLRTGALADYWVGASRG